jgi:hypothetical protein
MLPLRVRWRMRCKTWLGGVEGGLAVRLRTGTAEVRRNGDGSFGLRRGCSSDGGTRLSVELREEHRQPINLRVDNGVAELDQGHPPDINPSLRSTRPSLAFPLLRGVASRRLESLIAAENPEYAFEVRKYTGEEEEPDLGEAGEEALVGERVGGRRRREFGGEGGRA